MRVTNLTQCFYKKNRELLILLGLPIFLAEKEGFEPPDLLQSTVFKTAAIDHSAISPIHRNHFLIAVANIESFFISANFLWQKNMPIAPL